MTSITNTVYVVIGGNRGIGLGLVRALLSRPSTTIFATVSNDKSRSALETTVAGTSMGNDSSLNIIQLDLSTTITPEQIRNAFDIDHVDVLINNAATTFTTSNVLEIPSDDLRSAFEFNTIVPLTVIQGLWPLLQKSSAPKVVHICFSVGNVAFHQMTAGAYGPSKTALLWLTRALHYQNEGLVSFALQPGFVGPDMGELAPIKESYPGVILSNIDETAKLILGTVDGATRETVSGKFVTHMGQELPW